MKTENQSKQIRIPAEHYEAIKKLMEKKGFSTIWEALKAYLAQIKGVHLEDKETIERRIRKEIVSQCYDYFKRIREDYENKTKTLENEKEQIKKSLEKASKEIESWKSKYELLESEHKALKEYHDTVLKELDSYKNSDIDVLVKSLEEKDSEIKRLNGLMEELKSKTGRVEELIRENERLKMENNSLKDKNMKMQLELKELSKDSVNRAKELKFIKETLEKEINQIMSMDSVIDIKLALKKLQKELKTKINYELEREGEETLLDVESML